MKNLFCSAAQLEPVPLAAYSAYRENAENLISRVDRKMAARSDIGELIGGNPIEIMFANHRHHCLFMQTVFCLSDFSMLVKTVAWVYRAYCAHGFKKEYFPVELQTWITEIKGICQQPAMKSVIAVYEWLLEHHDDFCLTVGNYSAERYEIEKDWLAVKEPFKSALIEGDKEICLKLATGNVDAIEKVAPFYQQVIQPCMYEIGYLWESAQISVAREHLATAIVSVVMTAINLMNFKTGEEKGKAIITSACNEYHEMGAWMLSDLLSNDGWKVTYLGANTPVKDLLEMACSIKPDIVAISVTMPYNLVNAVEVINGIKANPALKKVKTLAGGRCICDHPDIGITIGADACAANASEGVKIARDWFHNKTGY